MSYFKPLNKLVKNKKQFTDISFPSVGEVIQAYGIANCFNENYILCRYGELEVYLKECDTECIEEKKTGQLSLF